MIICTEDDDNFKLYKESVQHRKVVFTIKQIFADNWKNFIDAHPNITIRDIVFASVEKVLTCKTLAAGYSVYICECMTKLFVCYTCKSIFCSSCGNKYNEARSISLISKLFRSKHRHVVFTIPEELRRVFREDRKRFNLLFKASQLTIEYIFKNKHKGLKSAFISVLHTYGRDLKFNPHIHMILLDSGISKTDFVKISYFNYASLRRSFMKVLLDLIEDEIGKKEFRKFKNKLCFDYRDGFYVFGPPSNFKSPLDLIKYVCRYLARPVMAESRIIDYDGKYVTFWYARHDNKKIVVEKVTVFDFISRIIIHIPDKNMKYIRYHGAYHNSSIINIDCVKLVSEEQINWKKKCHNWRDMIIWHFQKNPQKCPNCNKLMVYYNTEFT
ncbi:MAG: transposase [Bacilli bacterium]|nr:transposase [Bacilli bacterium]MDD4734330.1 transposase [Bacilli bacterium]